jgi:octaprenyl-diphosphate synthase
MVARQIETSEEKYLQVITAKTAVLFAAACQIAAVVAERDEACEAALESFGRNLGIAFQLVDDAIDYMSDAETMGKGQGDDFREGKLTLPVILAYRRGDDEARRFWRDAMEGRRKSDEDLAEAIERLKTSGSIADTLARARHYGELAIDAIADMPASSAKVALTETVRFAIARAF